jgi:hypothetical protein
MNIDSRLTTSQCVTLGMFGQCADIPGPAYEQVVLASRLTGKAYPQLCRSYWAGAIGPELLAESYLAKLNKPFAELRIKSSLLRSKAGCA